MFDAGTILGRLRLDNSGFAQGILQSQALTATLGGNITAFIANPWVGVVNLVKQAAGAYWDFVRDTARQADQFAKIARATGANVEFLSGMAHAARLSGVDYRSFEMALSRLIASARDAQQGLPEAKRAFDELGISAVDGAGKLRPTEELFLDIAEAIRRQDNAMARAAITQELFGRNAAHLVPLLAEGRGGLRALIEEAKRLGVAFGDQAAQDAERFNDSWERLTSTLRGAAMREALGNLNELTGVVRGLTAAVGPLIRYLDWFTTYTPNLGTALRLFGRIVGPGKDQPINAPAGGADRQAEAVAGAVAPAMIDQANALQRALSRRLSVQDWERTMALY